MGTVAGPTSSCGPHSAFGLVSRFTSSPAAVFTDDKRGALGDDMTWRWHCSMCSVVCWASQSVGRRREDGLVQERVPRACKRMIQTIWCSHMCMRDLAVYDSLHLVSPLSLFPHPMCLFSSHAAWMCMCVFECVSACSWPYLFQHNAPAHSVDPASPC